MNQLTLAAIAAAVLAAGSFTAGWRVNAWRHDSQQLAVERAIAETAEATTTAAVDAIKEIKIQRTTIRQELEREIHYAPVVGPECDISDGVLDTLNKGLTPPSRRGAVVPGPDPAD